MALDLSLVYANQNEVNKHLVDTYGWGYGQAEWLNATENDTSIDATLEDFNTTDTELEFSGLSTANTLEIGQVLTLHKSALNERVYLQDFEYSNAGKTAGTITIIRASHGINGHGDGPHMHIVSSASRVQACQIATQLINNYHGQYYSDNELFLETEFKPIAILAALYVNRVIAMSLISEKIKAVSSGSYDDSVLSISSAAELTLPNVLKQMLDRILNRWGYSVGYQRA
jgi:hypothetical protein